MRRSENGFRHNDYYASRAVISGCLSSFKKAPRVDVGSRSTRAAYLLGIVEWKMLRREWEVIGPVPVFRSSVT
jgi:hypothetical protein